MDVAVTAGVEVSPWPADLLRGLLTLPGRRAVCAGRRGAGGWVVILSRRVVALIWLGDPTPTLSLVLHVLVDTSTWLDLAKRRDGQKWIVAVRLLVQGGDLELLVPPVVLDEFARNRERVEASMTASVAQRFKLLHQDLLDYGGDAQESARDMVRRLSYEVPLIGAMTTRNFDDIEQLLRGGRQVLLSDHAHQRVVARGLAKRAPFHRGKNSVADALLIEAYGELASEADLTEEPHGFVTSNHDDFSADSGDRREPHSDLTEVFDGEGSLYWLSVDGLDQALRHHFGTSYDELLDEVTFEEEPRRLDEIMQAEQECFDRVWYHRSLNRESHLTEDAQGALEDLRRIAGPARRRVEEAYGHDSLGPYTDFEWGMLNGKLSALRWVLGSEWDFLDT
jgi:hypothetical protein